MTFCTLFDSVYLSRGMAMYESLRENSDDFHLYIFAFDDLCDKFLRGKNLKYVTVISLCEFEDERLLSVKENRSAGEYCWTCTPSIILYVLNNYNVDHCTYIDADLFFFDSPQILIDELGDSSIMITEHRYTKRYDQTSTSGKYCVQFVFFKNDLYGRKALEWWRNACLDWCYARQEDGKFGDQKYLDDWCVRFEKVHELKHLGGGVAPWNMQQYSFFKENDRIYGVEKDTGKKFGIVFFHFHALLFLSPVYFSFSPDYIKDSKNIYRYFFMRYISTILKVRNTYPEIHCREQYSKLPSRFKHPLIEKVLSIWCYVIMKLK